MKRLYVFGLLAFGLALSAHAQLNSSAPWSKTESSQQTLGTTPKPPPPPSSPTPTDAPLDGGLGVLIVAGALYGKRAYKRKTVAQPAGSSL